MSFTITTDLAGQINVNPRRVTVVSTDDFSTVTSPGYLNSTSSQGNPIFPTDIMEVIYSYNSSEGTGTYGKFLPSITNGVITLNLATGDVVLPTVAGHFASFSDTTGGLIDNGYLPSDDTLKTLVCSDVGTQGDFAIYADAQGTIGDIGLAPSDSNQSIVACVTDSPTPAEKHLAVFYDTVGTISDAGAKIISGTTAPYAGGGTSNAFTVTGLTSSAVGSAVIRASTNAVSVAKALPGTDTLTITFSADPGASTTVDYIYTTAGLTN